MATNMIAAASRIWEEPGRWIFLSYLSTAGFSLEWYESGRKVKATSISSGQLDKICFDGSEGAKIKLSPAAIEGIRETWPNFKLKTLG